MKTKAEFLKAISFCTQKKAPHLSVMVPKKHKSHPFMLTEQKPPSTLSSLAPGNPWLPWDVCSPP